MNWIKFIAVSLVVLATLATPQMLRACPLCAEAIANANGAGDDDDKDDFPAAMNQSIYLMLGVPYMAFGVVGLLIYRGVKKNEAHVRALQQDAAGNCSPV
jgi:hypothetical protein